jgi:hypothetical protein
MNGVSLLDRDLAPLVGCAELRPVSKRKESLARFCAERLLIPMAAATAV